MTQHEVKLFFTGKIAARPLRAFCLQTKGRRDGDVMFADDGWHAHARHADDALARGVAIARGNS